MSLLLDIYGELLTERQRTFLRRYFEEDLSFGEIAREYGISRQAIFDAVKHGIESLEHFEAKLGLVRGGWAWVVGGGLTAGALAEELQQIRAGLENGSASEPEDTAERLSRLIGMILPSEEDEPVEATK